MGDRNPRDLKRAARRTSGVYYTPAVIANYIVRETLSLVAQPSGDLPRVLDPACGDGVFLGAVYRQLVERRCHLARSQPLTFAERRDVLLEQVFGIDTDPGAVEAARMALARLACDVNDSHERTVPDAEMIDSVAKSLAPNIRCGNALRDVECLPKGKPFDAIVGNPPYVNIRLLTRGNHAVTKQYFQQRFRCATGAYDLYVLFIERSLELLRPGGVCGLIVPNKLATADYAARCREMLLRETALHRIDDLTALNVFPDAGVYPYVLVCRKGSPAANHAFDVSQVDTLEELATRGSTRHISQASLSAGRGFAIHGELDVESRVATEPLGRRAVLHSGATGFTAHRLADALQEQRTADAAETGDLEFVVSGNIDRYSVRLGNVRFMQRTFRRPVLPQKTDVLSDNKRQLYCGAKLVIAGMTRRLEAAYDPGGLALGVQVYAAAEPTDDPRYLLGLLNSKLLSHLYRLRFGAKRLAGGYLAINKGPLGQLPIRVIDHDSRVERHHYQRLISLVTRMQELRADQSVTDSGMAARQRTIQRVDGKIDRLVYQLYNLTNDEIRLVEKTVA